MKLAKDAKVCYTFDFCQLSSATRNSESTDEICVAKYFYGVFQSQSPKPAIKVLDRVILRKIILDFLEVK